MDPVDALSLARQLIDIESTTGNEGEVAAWLASFLRGRGYSVLEQPLEAITGKPRINVIAAAGEPEVVFSTHFDCVPPFFPSRVEHGKLYGRGACDAKGILAAQVAAAERLRARGETRVGLVFVGGEERGSDGAKAANRIASKARFLINGEPTDLRLGAATRGAFRVRLTARGKAAHSGYPELGESAIEKLIDCLVSLRGAGWPSDPLLGTTHYTIGLINGGVAPNVIPRDPEAGACGSGGGGGGPGAAGAAHAHRAGLRDRGVLVFQRHPLPVQLGYAAPDRARLHPRRPHRPGTPRPRRARPRCRRIRKPRRCAPAD
jgi:acetylornithine deacetylase